MRSALLLGLLLGLCALQPTRSLAVDLPDQADQQDLLALLESETELATKSGMNAVYVPGMTTLLSGDELLARGARTVWEALSLVPGMSQGLEMTGERQVLSRGVGYGYASGNIKIMLDGVSMNSTLLATANAVLNIPIEQVERIEVIRGPGSSVHGEYAYAGAVNVITRQRGRSAQARADEAAASGAGVVWRLPDATRDWALTLNLMGLEGDGDGPSVARDALYPTDRAELSNAPGRSNEARRYQALFTSLEWGRTLFDLHLLQDDYGDHFGINHFLPPDDHNLASRSQYVTVRISQDLRLSDSLTAKVRLEGMRHERKRSHLYVFPAGYLAEAPVYMSQDYQESRYLGALDLHWSPSSRHQWLLAAEATHIEVDTATWDWSGFPGELAPTWLDEERSRDILSAVLQDQFRLSEQLSLTATLRHDDYSDFGSLLSPRLAAVWRIDAEHVLKLQYARAFRPPTFFELEYSRNGSLDASEIATYELGYILTRPRWQGRAILFQSDLSDPIAFDEVHLDGYVNGEDVRLRGIELEYLHRLGSRLKVDANLSYVDAVRSESGAALPGGANLLGNLALLWRPHERWTGAIQVRYVGKRHRSEYDGRSDLGGYTLLDLTLSYRASGGGPYAYLGIKNLLDSRVAYIDQLTGYGGVDLEYADDYPRPGRRWWVSVGYSF